MKKATVGVMSVLVLFAASFLALTTPAFGVEESENSWVSKAPMKTARAYLGLAAVNGKIYAIGGDQGHLNGVLWDAYVMTGEVTNATEEYDPSLNGWIVKSQMPTARARFGIAVYQNKIYCIGGYNKQGTTYKDVWANEVYDPATDTWEVKRSLPTDRLAPATNVVDGKIYVIGGSSIETHSALNVVEVYDPETDTWETKTPPPLEVKSSASAVVDNKIYVLGEDPDEGGRRILVFDPATDSWSVKARASANIWASAAATTGLNALKRIYFFDSTWTTVYDPANDSWSVGASAPTPRPVAGAVAVDELIYVIGGRTGESGYYLDMRPSSVNEQYTPFGYGTIPPVVSVISSQDPTYSQADVPLVFSVNKPVIWIGYSLDGQDNVTVVDNATMTGLSDGVHNVTVYAKDSFGNVGVSDAVSFIVAVNVPFPTVFVAVASGVSVAVVCLGLLLYFKTRKH